MVTKVKKWGNGLGIKIPKTYLNFTNIEENDEVSFEKRKDGLFIKLIKTNNIEYMVSKISDKNKHRLFDFGSPVGKEMI